MAYRVVRIKPGTVSDPGMRTDLISGADHQMVKMEYGAEGAATPVTTSAPLPAADPPAGASDTDTIPASATTVEIVPAGAVAVVIENDSPAEMKLAIGEAATLAHPHRIPPGETVALDGAFLTGEAINGIWTAGGTGNARAWWGTR
jgi:hypothetical protein